MSVADQKPSTQPTQPAKGEPIDIPVPKTSTIDKLLKKAAQPLAPRRPRK